MMRTGIRVSELATLQMQDLTREQGHSVVVIRHDKGDKRRLAKVPVGVVRSIKEYLDVAEQSNAEPSAPLFGAVAKGGHAKSQALTTRRIQKIVERYASAIAVKLSPHGLRATFITITLEGGARLQQVQYAASRADSRTTERYQRRKLNLDDNGVDYFKF